MFDTTGRGKAGATRSENTLKKSERMNTALRHEGPDRVPISDFLADMEKMADDPELQRWWTECKPCFEDIEGLPPGEVWSPMDSVFFQA